MHLKSLNSQSPWLFSLLLISPFFFWGTAMVAMKGSLPHTTPFFVATLRLVPAGLLILLTGWLTQRPQPQGIKAWLWISLFALIDGTLFQGFLAQGLVRTNAGLGSVMIDSQPLAVALMAAWLFGETIGWWGALGLILGVSGISLIGLPDEWILGGFPLEEIQIGQIFQNGQGLMLFAALSMAIGTILIRYVSRHADPVMATGWHMILGGLPLMLGSGLWESHQWDHLLLTDWLAIAYSTTFGSAIAYGLFFYFASSGNLTSLSSLTFLTPVFALFFGNLILEEVLSPLQWLGVGLTLISIYLVNQRETLAAKFNLKFSPNPDSSLAQQRVEIDKHNP
ncbi:DMT family transporter [Roseofilum sp. BLCC_M154]|uniref:DMT family transporter n=1 Tax=Roseofilum acuticapitatum BLCC-M154 TaxID=3022444 RepID=A0ABT7AYT5_9CYAN|nr:DMT family transporter [Roseofilum acuticapitatum]MDJ1172066.1 DMT family transporter [Roseofilum acuticapitatum BLCC-M154]